MAQFNQHPATIKFKINLAMAGIKFSKSGLSKKSTLAVAKLGALTLFAASVFLCLVFIPVTRGVKGYIRFVGKYGFLTL